jgi:hypothetical protein
MGPGVSDHGWEAPTIHAVASYPTEHGWRAVYVMLRPHPPGMASKPYWEAEVARLRARHEELRDVSSFVITEL